MNRGCNMEQREDFLGQILEPGDYVLGSQLGCKTPELFEVVGFTAKRIKVKELGRTTPTVRTASDLLKVDAHLVTMFKLKQQGK